MVRIATFNCRSIKSSIAEVRTLCENVDICLLQEHWLYNDDLTLLSTIHNDFHAFGVSAMDCNRDIISGRPYGGTAILWRKSYSEFVSVKTYGDPRIIGVELSTEVGPCLILCVYLPTDCSDHFDDFCEYLGKIDCIIQDAKTPYVLSQVI